MYKEEVQVDIYRVLLSKQVRNFKDNVFITSVVFFVVLFINEILFNYFSLL